MHRILNVLKEDRNVVIGKVSKPSEELRLSPSALSGLLNPFLLDANPSLCKLGEIRPRDLFRQCANMCRHPQHEFVCAAVGKPANRVSGLPTDGGAVSWHLAHQRCSSIGLLLCVCACFRYAGPYP
nr:hypothetical transcript [Hymenolepis microstoma]